MGNVIAIAPVTLLALVVYVPPPGLVIVLYPESKIVGIVILEPPLNDTLFIFLAVCRVVAVPALPDTVV